jgi:hypothetical protein
MPGLVNCLTSTSLSLLSSATSDATTKRRP